MQTTERILYNWSIPPKNKFFVALFYLDFKFIVLILKPIIKRYFLKKCENVDFIPWFKSMYGNIIWKNIFLSDANFIDYAPIYIWEKSNIWFWCTLITASHNPNNYSEILSDPIWIWEQTFIWTNSIILQWVHIWNNVTIWAGSVVTKDIPDNCVAVWNPAKVIKYNN